MQSLKTLGFQAIKSVVAKVPNIAEIMSHVSDMVVRYHAVQVLMLPLWVGVALAVMVGGMGGEAERNEAIQ